MSISRDRPPSLNSTGRPIRPRSPAEALEPTRAPSRPRGSKTRRGGGSVTGLVRFISGVMTAALMAMVLAGGAIFMLNFLYDAPGPLASDHTFTVRAGDGRIQIAENLEGAGVISSRQLFVINHFARNFIRRVTGGTWRDLKAGEYHFAAGASMRNVLDAISDGRTLMHRITIPEGLTSQQVVARLSQSELLSGEIETVPTEGTLLPATYDIGKGSERKSVITRMQAEQARVFDQLWDKRAQDLPIQTKEEALILASIVEKETGVHSERPRVAAVFVNRMRKGMRLQSDPTIIYGIVGGRGSLGRPLYRSDLNKKTPYNTYTIDGLPPTPICNPGRDAIAAVLNPTQTDELYFVADGTGGHKFSKTLKEHNAAVANWRRIEKEARARAVEAEKAKRLQAATESQTAQAAATGDGMPVSAAATGATFSQTNAIAFAGADTAASQAAAAIDSGDAAAAQQANAAPAAKVPLPVRKPR